MFYYLDAHGCGYRLMETTFTNPANGAETLLFLLINESDAIIRASASSMDSARWIKDFDLELQPKELTR